jgi:cytosolic 5'-nucleotidase 3
MTLTRYWVDGARSVSSHGVLEKSSILPMETRLALKALYHKYYPMEVDTKLSFPDKVKAMVEWWAGAHDLIMAVKLTKQNIRDMVAETPVSFREGLSEFVGLCHAREVPLLVFSAGLYDMIEVIFDTAGHLKEYVSIVSNKMIWSDDEVCIGFEEPIIHTFK